MRVKAACKWFFYYSGCEIYSALSFEEKCTQSNTTRLPHDCGAQKHRSPVFHDMSPLKCWLSKQASLSRAIVNKCEKLCLSSELGVSPNKKAHLIPKSEAVSERNQLAGRKLLKAGLVLNVL